MAKRNKSQQCVFTEHNGSFSSEDHSPNSPSDMLIKKRLHPESSPGPRLHSRRHPPDFNKDSFLYISQLYQEYLNDFISRVHDRLSSKHPYEHLHRYTLEVDKDFRSRLQTNILSSRESYSETELLGMFTACVNRFVEGLKRELKSLRNYSRRLQIICCNEAYSTMKNASREIERIVAPAFSAPEVSCRALNTRIFYDEIICAFDDLVEYAHDEETRDENLREFLHIKQALLISVGSSSGDSEDPLSDLYFSLASDSEENRDEQLYQMDLDELVTYINSPTGSDLPKKSKKKKKSAGRSAEDSEIDREIECFRRKLDAWVPLSKKLQPSLSPTYLSKLRALIRISE